MSVSMPISLQDNEFLETAVAAIPKIVDLIAAMPPEDRAGALDVAEYRFLRTAKEFGCAESASRNWTDAVMRVLRGRLEDHVLVKRKLKSLHEELTADAPGRVYHS